MTTFSESTASDWDTQQSEEGVHHEQPAGTDWATADTIEKGYAADATGWSMPSPAHYWPLAESSGSTANDVVGASDATYQGGPALAQVGILGKNAINCDGVDDYIDYGEPIVLDNGGWTFNIWVNFDTLPSTTNDQYIFTYENGSTSDDVYLYGDDTDEFASYTGGTRAAHATTITTGDWYMCTARYQTDGSYHTFINGADKTSNAEPISPADTTNGYQTFKNPSGGRAWGDGSLCHSMLWDSALTDAQISTLYDVATSTSAYWTDKKTS